MALPDSRGAFLRPPCRTARRLMAIRLQGSSGLLLLNIGLRTRPWARRKAILLAKPTMAPVTTRHRPTPSRWSLSTLPFIRSHTPVSDFLCVGPCGVGFWCPTIGNRWTLTPSLWLPRVFRLHADVWWLPTRFSCSLWHVTWSSRQCAGRTPWVPSFFGATSQRASICTDRGPVSAWRCEAGFRWDSIRRSHAIIFNSICGACRQWSRYARFRPQN